MAFRLTKRQCKVLDLLASGFTEGEICGRLKIAEDKLANDWRKVSEVVQTSEPKGEEDLLLLAKFERVERQRLERELWASEARLTALMDVAPEAVLLIHGRSGRILKVNNRALLLLGYAPRELLGEQMEMLLEPDVRSKHVHLRHGFLGNVRKREIGYHPPIFALSKDGKRIELEIALTATASTDDVMVVCRPIAAPQKDVSQTVKAKLV